MDRLEKDLKFFTLEYEKEKNLFRKNLLLSQIRDIKQEQLNLLKEERRRCEIQNRNLQEALDFAMKMKKK
jgi:hypothetical protein